MQRNHEIDKKIQTGYKYMLKKNSTQCCDEWLSAWEDIKDLMVQEGAQDISELDKKFEWTQFIFNYVQDMEMELGNAGVKDKAYYHKRIKYCKELLESSSTDKKLIENTRRGIAESHAALGDFDTCDQLFREWLQADPGWGYGYIGWAFCYERVNQRGTLAKAQEILLSALQQDNLRDRPYVLDRAFDISFELGDMKKVQELKAEIMASPSRVGKDGLLKQAPASSAKTGRNDPCPCVSGKKYKKCCGRL